MRLKNLRFEEFFPVAGEQYISKPVNFEQIPVDIVPPEASDRKVPVVLDVGNLLGVAEVYQPCLRQLEAKILILKARQVRRDAENSFGLTNLLGFILSQGVVHVEPIELDLVQSEGTIDKNPEI